MLKIPYEYIILLNPSYKRGIIPADNNMIYTLRLPKDYIAAFINNEQELYAFKANSLISLSYMLKTSTGMILTKMVSTLSEKVKHYPI